jgi:hypothetical protein
VVFVPHPCLRLVRASYPVDLIWRAVLGEDDAAMAAIDLAAGPVQLLVERGELTVNVERIGVDDANFLDSLCRGMPLEEAIDLSAVADVATILAGHFKAGRFVDFGFAGEAEHRSGGEAVA